MTTIHMETEAVHQEGRELMSHATALSDLIGKLSAQQRVLRGAWQGGDSESVLGGFSQVIANLKNQVEELDQLGLRVIREVNEWEGVDKTNSFGEYVKQNWLSLAKDGARIVVAGGFWSMLGTSLARPNSIVFTAPPLLKDIFGGQNLRNFIFMNKKLNIIKPGNLAKSMLWANLAIDVGPQLIQDFKAYGLSSRFTSAAVVDTVVKGALSLASVGAVYLLANAVGAGVTALVAAGAITVASPGIVVGGAVLLTWVAGSVIVNQVAQTPLWNAFNSSGYRDLAIEKGVRVINEVRNFAQGVAQTGIEKVKNAFGKAIQQLSFSPA